MKKILSILAAFVIATCSSYAATTTNWNATDALNRVNTIGNKILKAYNLPQGITFKVSEEDHVNAYANINKEVYVYKGLLQFVENDQELAAVLAHEIGHIINAHCAKQTMVNYMADIATSSNLVSEKYASAAETGKQLAMLKMSREDEYDADLTGVDLLGRAGYDTRAMISVLNKICENSFDVISTHPSGEKRLLNVYDYIAYKYPNVVKTTYTTDSYKVAMVAINQTIKERNTKKNGIEKHNKKMAKLYEKRQKQMAKNASRATDPWSMGFTLVNSLTQ